MDSSKRFNDSDSEIEEVTPKKFKLETESMGKSKSVLGVKNVVKKQTILFAKKASVNEEKTLENETKTKKFVDVEKFSMKKENGTEKLRLAERLRPKKLEDVIGHDEILGKNMLLPTLLRGSAIPSIILWGPPGSGKTTLSRILIDHSKTSGNYRTAQLSAATCNIADIKEIAKIAKNDWTFTKKKTILFVDEIHRLNKLQQDAFLVQDFETGIITLIGATTQNPSFSLNNALLSRCKVITLNQLSIDNMLALLNKSCKALNLRSCTDEEQDSEKEAEVDITQEALRLLAIYSNGDARIALNNLECLSICKKEKSVQVIDKDFVKHHLAMNKVTYDRNGEEHYNCISAFQKSIRGSDENAAIYWLSRMLEGGEDPLFIARRLVVTASEDIGLADSNGLTLAVSTLQACQMIGQPECSINLAHCTTYLARAKKSNESYMAYRAAVNSIQERDGLLPQVPLHLRNASTKFMKELGYGQGYNHSNTQLSYLPPELEDVNFFQMSSK